MEFDGINPDVLAQIGLPQAQAVVIDARKTIEDTCRRSRDAIRG